MTDYNHAYRKKPVVIEAHLFDGSQESGDELNIWSKGAIDWSASSGALLIDTLEGTLVVMPGDMVIRGVKGEFYPCKPDIFEETYERYPPSR